jgi:nucleoside-diphosphate-sugar epimerase
MLTGAFGNVGQSALAELVQCGHTVRCFDMLTRANARTARRLHRRYARAEGAFEVVWGDLRNRQNLVDAARDQGVVVHLAFIIPKLSATGVESEDRPAWAREINVGGTRNLIQALKAQPRPPKLLFASSYHIYGRTQDQNPPRTLADPVHPIEHYAQHKVECEKLVRNSGLQWAIFRLAAALPLSIRMDRGMFDIPLDNRMEFVHTRDVGTAICHAVSTPDVWRRTLLIGGGPRCQYRYGDITRRVLEGLGVGMLPSQAFGGPAFPTDWLDTTESEALLHYQHRDLGDYVRDMRRLLGFQRFWIQVFRPLVRLVVLRRSSYWRAAKSKQRLVKALDAGAAGVA